MKIYGTTVTTVGKEHLYINGECFVKNVYVLPDGHTYLVKHYDEIIPVFRMSDYYTNNIKSYIKRQTMGQGLTTRN